MRCTTAWMLAGVLLIVPVTPLIAAEADGVKPGGAQVPWARWQGRLSLVTTSDPWRLGVEGPSVKLSSATLMGDYYFARSWTGLDRPGGLRATSGLIFGPRSAPSTGQPGGNAYGSTFSIDSRSAARPLPYSSDVTADNATVPYLGIGYTGLSPRNGWGFSADLGLVAKGSRLARNSGVGPSLDDAVRDIRMTPLLQLGASYSF
jgi:hypothetical protein